MLTIKNTHQLKLWNVTPDKEWVVTGVEPVIGYNPTTKSAKNYYSIKIYNVNSTKTEEVLLNRDKENDGWYDWYILSCIRNGKEHKKQLMLRDIQNKKWLLRWIKQVALD